MDIVNNFSKQKRGRKRKNEIVNILRKNKKKYNIKYEQFFSYES
jgi:hypothetical protein